MGKLVAALLILGAALLGLLAVEQGSGLDRTISNANEIERQFREAETVVDEFIAQHRRLPNPEEFATLRPDGTYRVDFYPNGFSGIGFDCSHQFTKASDGDYVLTVWRDEWMECYRPSLKLTTLATQESDFSIFGSIWLDRILLSFLAVQTNSLPSLTTQTEGGKK